MTLICLEVVNLLKCSHCFVSGFDGEVEELETSSRGDILVWKLLEMYPSFCQFLVTIYLSVGSTTEIVYLGPLRELVGWLPQK